MKKYTQFQSKINEMIRLQIKTGEIPNDLQEIMETALIGGKRLRPIITLCLQEALGSKFNIDNLILVPEYIHTTSLIIDDLPCMDNDSERRGVPTVHYKYGETAAQVSTMYLLAKTFNMIQDNLDQLKDQGLPQYEERVSIIYQCISDNLGIFGAPLGQYLDIFPLSHIVTDYEKSQKSLKRNITKVLEKKTATFFEIAFVLGYVASGGDLSQLERIKLCARTFGVAFQITDDFDDQEKDCDREYCPNLVNQIGKEESILTFNSSINLCKSILHDLNILHPVLDEIFQLLEERVLKYQN